MENLAFEDLAAYNRKRILKKEGVIVWPGLN
jgi:hypothetical protein